MLLFSKFWRRKPEVSDENKGLSVPEQALESVCEGQHEAAAGKRAAAFEPEPFSKRQRFEEEEEEEEDEFDSEEYRVETTDELYCGYDSTWETEQDQESSFRGSRRVYIHHFHDDWYGDYDTLEFVHTYIQWLFPLQEPGMNYEATPLTKEEVEDFLTSSTAKENLLKSYKLMLDFYGIELFDEKTGEVRRARNWRDRFNNLDSHTHNNLRITRILKCLGTLGYRHYQAPLVQFFLEETLVKRQLPRVRESVLNYFLFAVLDKGQRRKLIKFAFLKYDRKDEFVWCPKKIQMQWSDYKRDAHDLSPSKGTCNRNHNLDGLQFFLLFKCNKTNLETLK
uniref:Zgc:162182 n=1 Tax=Stegastes partitus TaxID=144197 RepID=A0A3B4ZQ18_9TELE